MPIAEQHRSRNGRLMGGVLVIAGVVAWPSGAARLAQAPQAGPIVTFDRYHTSAEFTAALQEVARRYPRLVKLEEIGRSAGGQPLWGVTLTNSETGPAEHKPGMYVDGNTHAGEVAGGEAALHLVLRLATGAGRDPRITEALDKYAYYVIPRVNPDGADLYLKARFLLTMRTRDSNGPLVTSQHDPRLMEPRHGHESGQWRVVGEQEVDANKHPVETKVGPVIGRVSNRNYPVGWWSPDYTSHGQGAYPLSEPEAKAQVDFVQRHPNINGLITYHTHSGLILRPYAYQADDLHLAKDLPYFEGIGRLGTDLTGYPMVSSYHSFTPDPTRPRLGTYKDWAYVQRGMIAWTIELWKAPGEEGLSAFHGLNQEKLLQFIDRELGGRYAFPWTELDHPQHGRVEIGGLDQRFVVQNPPPEFLARELEKVTPFAIAQGMTSPLVRITRTDAEGLGNGIYRVRASIQNQGYLPTAIPRAESLGLGRPVQVTLEGAEAILSEPATYELGTLMGWGPVGEGPGFRGAVGAPIKTVSWIVRGSAGRHLTVRAVSERGGRHQVSIQLREQSATAAAGRK